MSTAWCAFNYRFLPVTRAAAGEIARKLGQPRNRIRGRSNEKVLKIRRDRLNALTGTSMIGIHEFEKNVVQLRVFPAD